MIDFFFLYPSFKVDVIGIYHLTKKSLNDADEFVFKYNTLKFGETQSFSLLLTKS